MELLCLLTIRPAEDKKGEPIPDALEVDAFIPERGEHLSATMPAGGERTAQVARALMTVFPPAPLVTAAGQVRKKIITEMAKRGMGETSAETG
jgi:hypothetical protein